MNKLYRLLEGDKTSGKKKKVEHCKEEYLCSGGERGNGLKGHLLWERDQDKTC